MFIPAWIIVVIVLCVVLRAISKAQAKRQATVDAAWAEMAARQLDEPPGGSKAYMDACEAAWRQQARDRDPRLNPENVGRK